MGKKGFSLAKDNSLQLYLSKQKSQAKNDTHNCIKELNK